MTATANRPGPHAWDATGGRTSPGTACRSRCGISLHAQGVDGRITRFTQPDRGVAGG